MHFFITSITTSKEDDYDIAIFAQVRAFFITTKIKTGSNYSCIFDKFSASIILIMS